MMTKVQDNLLDHIDNSAQKWNAIAESCHFWIPRMREWYAPATNLMIDWAHLEHGNRLHSVFYPKEAGKQANRQPAQDVLPRREG